MSNIELISPVAVNDSENAADGKIFGFFEYEDYPCTENLWWIFILSCLSFPSTMLLGLGLWRVIRWSMKKCHPKGYEPVVQSAPAMIVINPRMRRRPSTLSESGYSGEDLFAMHKISTTETPLPQIVQIQESPTGMHWTTLVRKTASEIVSASSITGKVTVLVTFIVSMVSLGLYFAEVTNSHVMMIQEKCAPWRRRLDWQLEFICSLYLLMDYFIRFVAASNKFRFMFEVYSMVDYFTIPPAFLVVFLNHHWTGLRFLRALYVTLIPDLLQYFSILRKSSHIRLAQLISYLSGVIFVSAGFLHMIETYGDPHLDRSNAVLRSYWEYVYFAVVTASSVGFGDVVPITRLGRAFTIIFILFAFTLFAASVPELYRHLASHKRYGAAYHAGRGVRHVVVAGHMTIGMMENFLRVFFHNEVAKTDLKVVFVNRADPDLETEALLKRNATRIFYIQGSLLKNEDLVRACVKEAAACLILADKNASNPTAEDARSVMSVIAVKNASMTTRILVQLLHSRSTTHVRNIPGFSPVHGDSVVCFSTLELGLLAQSCIAPGSSTMISNLMHIGCRSLDHENEALKDYAHGSQRTIFMEQLSDFFEGKSFTEASKFCFLKLGVLLIGLLEPNSEKPSGSLLLNPTIQIKPSHVGIFIAKSAAEVSKVWYICKHCHSDAISGMVDGFNIQFCKCPERKPTAAMVEARDPFRRFRTFSSMCRNAVNQRTLPRDWERIMLRVMQQHPSSASLHKLSVSESSFDRINHLESIEEDAENEGLSLGNHQSERLTRSDESVLDFTKAFYSCPPKPYKAVVLNRSKAAKKQFSDHIIVLVLAGPQDSPIGFQDFMLPLRSTKFKYENLKDVVLLGDPDYLEKEWHKIRSLPKVTLVKGDPLDRADLRAVSIKSCAMCVILPSRSGSCEDLILDDKDAILATLNIMAMNFEKVDTRSRSASVIHPSSFRRAAREGFEVPIISALYHDVNVPLLDTCDLEKGDSTEVMMMEPYVCGYALPLSALDSILIANFFNPYALELIKALLFGDMSILTETFLTEGIGLISGEAPSSEAGRAGNTQLRLISLHDQPLSNRIPGGWTYGALFGEATTHGMICLGVARRAYPDAMGSRSMKRCVITSPPPNYQLRHDDLIYVLSS